ncbi:unnamed protein product [Auanema sp. JU1783]|nr:unnamed protein product [Auanema sp. JU1783]
MDGLYHVIQNIKTFYDTINPATLSGAIDVVVVEQPDGTFKSTPFHVRFGKYGVFNHSNKYVDITINGEEINLKMKLGDSGVAYFVEECEGGAPEYMITSPFPETILPQKEHDVQRVLDASVKKLEESQPRIRRNSLDDNQLSASFDASRDVHDFSHRQSNEEQSLSEVQLRLRSMPFPSSVFSNRKYRSLPDLSSICNDPNDCLHSGGKCEKQTQSSLKRHRFPHSKSQAFDKKLINDCSFESDDIFRRSFGRRKKSKKEESAPIDIKVNNDSDSELDSSLSSSTVSTPSPSLLDARDVADGALSDSEVDRHRKNETHENDVTDWKWGQLPETKENKRLDEKAQKPKKESLGWTGWLPWRSRTARSPSPTEEGITLDELSKVTSDPVKIQKYLGKTKSGSGHASRGASHPASPVTKSEDLDFLDETTPTQEIANCSINSSEKLDDSRGRMRNSSGPRSVSSSDDIFEDDLESIEGQDGKTYIRSLRLSSDRLMSLGLVRGANECRFSITTRIQGTCWCACNIYLYKWYERIVISDIDGTITKSDVLGHVIPAIGGTWAHSGVAELYTHIKNNGYKMVYLSSRAIGQSHTTKQYLRSVAQNSRQLPDGPVLLSPTSVLMAFRREVIERRPEEFKIAALSDLKKLFPVPQPAVGIPAKRILIIDPTGKVRRSDSVGYVSSYLSMANDTVDYLFPPLNNKIPVDNIEIVEQQVAQNWLAPLEHSTFEHWKQGNTDESMITDEEMKAYEAKRSKNKKI